MNYVISAIREAMMLPIPFVGQRFADKFRLFAGVGINVAGVGVLLAGSLRFLHTSL